MSSETECPSEMLTPAFTGRYPAAGALLLLVEAKHRPTYLHLCQVATYTEMLALWLHLPQPEVEQFTLAAMLHDVGKIALPAGILEKPDRLSGMEMELIRLHPKLGVNLLSDTGVPGSVIAAVRSHHERFDGKGYPDGTAGDQIPIGARMIAICDAFDAMTAPQPYRRRFSAAAALQEIDRGAGEQFDPDLAFSFSAMIREAFGPLLLLEGEAPHPEGAGRTRLLA